MTSAVRQKVFLILGLLAAGLVLATCGSTLAGRQHWSRKWGPLVPHKTFPGDCSLCHVGDSWTVLRADFQFDHAEVTGVPLLGAHAQAACLRCHNDYGPVAAYVARGCSGCHTDIHEGQLGKDCKRCHTEGTWRPHGVIADHARTRFPLVGRHIVTACILCHPAAPTGEYRGAPVQCAQCHRDDLARAASPDHRRLGWVNRCERCHIPTRWGGGGFLHAFWPLTGVHAVIDCSSCHVGDDFGPLPRDCFSCHQDDHARAPDHDFFPRRCESCHNTTTWSGAIFNHRFPLRGPHRLSCSDCHTTPDPRAFSCLTCHDHSRVKMDDKHSEVTDYRYDSAACLLCHPNGGD